jgi:carboxyl-terminal processing protease
MRSPAALAGLALALSLSTPARANPGAAAWAEAKAAYDQKDYERSAKRFADAIDAGLDDPRALYDAAGASALTGKNDRAFDYLGRTIQQGFHDVGQLNKDPDLSNLRSDPRWKPLIATAQAKSDRHDRFWNNASFKTAYRENLAEDEKIAGLSRLWSEVKFNFANFDLVPDLDWDAAFRDYLPKVRHTRSTLEYYRVLMELGAKLGDGHTGVFPPEQLSDAIYARPPLRTRLIEDKVIIMRVDDEALEQRGLAPGMEVLEIDGVPALAYGKNKIAAWQSASTKQDLAVRTYDYGLLRGAAGTSIALTVRDAAGKTSKHKLTRPGPGGGSKPRPDPQPMELKILPGKIAHVALNTFDSSAAADQFLAAFDQIAQNDAIIFDIRDNGGGSSQVGYRVLATLTDKAFKTSSWHTRDYRPTYRAWGLGDQTAGNPAATFGANATKRYRKPVIVLTSARTFSAAEDFAVAFDAMDRGPIIGEATAGSTGQPLFFDLPGGGRARVCTKRDTYPDGREFIGRGIEPDQVVHPTIADIRAGRDTVLEAALKALERMKVQ